MLAVLALAAPLAAQSPRFVEHTIATGLKGGYQVVAADINDDGKPDLIALASGMPDLVWYENPTWKRHVIFSGLNHMINCAAEDIDGDGIPEIALAWNFANNAANNIGDIGILRHEGDPGWEPSVIDDSLSEGHTILAVDFDRFGRDAIVAGFRGATGHGVFLYELPLDLQPEKRRRSTVPADSADVPAASSRRLEKNRHRLRGNGRVFVHRGGSKRRPRA